MSESPKGNQILTFFLADKLYGMPVQFIKEISTLMPIQHSGGGRVQLRSQNLPLVDLRSTFQLDASFFPAAHNLVVIAAQGKTCAVLVDGIDSVLRISLPQPAQSGLLPEALPFVSEIAVHGNKSIRVLDILACLGFPAQTSDENKSMVWPGAS
jgi:chemotaxis signal transduction protein